MRDPLTPLRHGFGIHYLQIIFKLAVNGLLSQLWFVSDPKEAVDNLRRQKALEGSPEQ